MTERVQVSMLYCGQGMCNWIEYYATDQQYTAKTPAMLALVDLGGDGVNNTAAPEYLAKRLAEIKTKIGATPTISAIVISHQDSDHWDLIDTFLSELKKQKITDLTVGKIWCGGKLWKKGALSAVERLRKATKSTITFFPDNCTDYEGHSDNIVGEGNCQIRLMIANAPCKLKSGGFTENGTSACIAVELAGRCVILPGDATWETMDFINEIYQHEDQPPPCYCLSLPHHGSLRTSVKGYTRKKKVEKMGWQFVQTFGDNIEAEQLGASAGYDNEHKHPFIEIIEQFEKYATGARDEHWLQAYVFSKWKWSKPSRKTPVYTTTCYVQKPAPVADDNGGDRPSKKRRIDPEALLEVAFRHLVTTMDDAGNRSLRSIWLTDPGSTPPAPPTAPPPSLAEQAAHRDRVDDAAE